MIYGIMGAMPEEVDQLCAKLQDVACETYAGVDYHRGTLHGKAVVVCCAGMGKANAASTVQVLCTRYGIGQLIFSGVAGNMTRLSWIPRPMAAGRAARSGSWRSSCIRW